MAEKRGVFLNPFGGRPAPIQLTRQFMLSPAVFMKLMGVPFNKALKELGVESTVKSIKYHQKRGQDVPARLVNEMLQLLPDGEVRKDFQQASDAFSRGELGPEDVLGPHGEWECFLQGVWLRKTDEERSYSSHYLVTLSEALWNPEKLIQSGEFAAAARDLYRNKVTAELASPEMYFSLAAVTSRRRLVWVQWAITLETTMSLLAAWCAGMQMKSSDEITHDLTSLIADEDGRRVGFGRSFFRFLMHVTKQKSMGSLSDHLSQVGDSIDIQTLKRWSAGQTLPDETQVRVIIQRCCPDDEERIMSMHWAMRCLSLLGYISESFVSNAVLHAKTPGAQEQCAPWPYFPFGYESFHDWAAGRLPFWCQYHLDKLAAAKINPAASVEGGAND